MNRDKISLSYKPAVKFLISLLKSDFHTEFNFIRNQLMIYNADYQKQIKYNYPLIINLTESIIKDKNLLHNFLYQKPPFLLLLIQAGNAAVGMYEGDKLLKHKVIRKYVTRKKQGKAQITYLKTKGKSRAGSRIRLANTVLFFEEINQFLNGCKQSHNTTIIYSCGPLLWGMLFKSKISPPFKKKDPQLKKLPLSIDVPNFEILKNTAHFSQKGYIQIYPECQENIKQRLLSSLETIKTV